MIYTQLRAFHAVAAEGSFTAAAKALRVGQPTITTHVRELESRFQVELFHRRGRRAVLTEAGEALLAVTQRLVTNEAEAVDLLRSFGGFRSGHLRVGAVGPYHVTEMLAAFNERYPGVSVSVRVGNSKEVLQSLFDFSADVAVLAHTEDDPRLLAIPYSRHPVVVFVNRRHPWSARDSIRIEELEGARVVLREVGSTTRLAFEEALARAGIVIDPVMEIGSREAVWMAVRRGIGLGIVSEIEFYPDPRLHKLRVSNAEIFTYAHVVCLAERQESRLIRAFLTVVETLLAGRRAHAAAKPSH